MMTQPMIPNLQNRVNTGPGMYQQMFPSAEWEIAVTGDWGYTVLDPNVVVELGPTE